MHQEHVGPVGTELAEQTGHRLVPMWEALVEALPRFGEVCAVSRNQHVVLGGRCRYPAPGSDPAGPDEPCFHHDFTEWEEGWFYREVVRDCVQDGLELRDSQGMGFHKIILTPDSDLDFARHVLHAFEQEPLREEEVMNAIRTNHLDGACCPTCQARARMAPAPELNALEAFLQRAIDEKRPLGAMVFHPGLVSLRRFVPEQWLPHGLWLGLAGNGTRLFLRPSGFGSVRFSRLDPEDNGPCDITAIRHANGDLLATLILEEAA